MLAKTLMVQGTASSVGKSLLVTALCRIFKQRGFRVAPFKSQNMSLNSYVTDEGLEMGRAQVSQARAAGIEPSALMNPILLKPCSNRKSQVIVNGKVRCTLSAQEYFARKEMFLPDIKEAFTRLASSYDIIVIEGAGSPAEINLAEKDFVNMGMADIANAPVLLIGDINRGGVFASLYGTIKLLSESHQKRIKGLVINKFRGDLSILAQGLSQLEALVDTPVLGVLPFEKFAIDEEDSLTERFSHTPSSHSHTPSSHSHTPSSHSHTPSSHSHISIVVPKLPRISNFTDFSVFDSFPACTLTYCEDAKQISQADLILLPGSKNTIEDLHWLNATGIGHAIRSASRKGTPIIGICGGFQMLGNVIHDPLGVEGAPRSVEGLGLLDMETFFQPEKYTVQTKHTLLTCPGMLQELAGMTLEGYEIHMGQSEYGSQSVPLASCIAQAEKKTTQNCSSTNPSQKITSGICNVSGNVIGTYLHGIFDNLTFTQHIIDTLAQRKSRIHNVSHSTSYQHEERKEIQRSEITLYSQIQEREYDRLAAMVEKHLDMNTILRILENTV